MEEIRQAIQSVVSELGVDPLAFGVERPKEENHGDWSTNIAMIAANKLGENPRVLAEKIITKLQNDVELASIVQLGKIEVAGPGFINFWVTK